jgi:hypothetical protein
VLLTIIHLFSQEQLDKHCLRRSRDSLSETITPCG